jgi:hypothetical protein
MSALIRGAKLTPAQRAEVFSAFVHRHLAIGPGRYYPTETAWLHDHAFYITRGGRLALRPAHCEPAFLAEAR